MYFPSSLILKQSRNGLSEVEESQITSDGPTGLGTAFVDRVRFMGRSLDFHFVITRYEPHRYIGYRSSGSRVKTKVEYSLEDNDRNTHLTVTVELDLPWYLRLLGPMFIMRVRKLLGGNYSRLKRLAESAQ